jgi:predicted secreted protein
LTVTSDAIDVTHLNSDNTYKEVIAGFHDGGELSIEGNFIPSDTNGQVGFKTDLDAGTLQAWVLTFPTAMATTWTFNAIVTAFSTTADVSDKVGFSATLKVSGKPALGVTASNNITVLTITTATLYPTFAEDTYDYVGTCTGDLKFAATFAAGTCAMYVDGTLQENLTSTVDSGTVDTGASGDQTEVSLVVTQSGKAPVTYTFDIARTA